MLGSHFDLAKEIETIAGRRGIDESSEERARSTAAYVDFDKRIKDFVDALTPVDRDRGTRHIIGSLMSDG